MPVKITSSFKPFLIFSKVKRLQNTQLIGTRRNFSILCGGATVGIVFTWPSRQARTCGDSPWPSWKRWNPGTLAVLCVFSIKHCTLTTPVFPSDHCSRKLEGEFSIWFKLLKITLHKVLVYLDHRRQFGFIFTEHCWFNRNMQITNFPVSLLLYYYTTTTADVTPIQ